MQVLTDTHSYDIEFSHIKGDDGRPFATLCLVMADGGFVGTGTAWCAANDQFDRRVGRKIAMQRGLLSCVPDKKERTVIWQQYLATQKTLS